MTFANVEMQEPRTILHVSKRTQTLQERGGQSCKTKLQATCANDSRQVLLSIFIKDLGNGPQKPLYSITSASGPVDHVRPAIVNQAAALNIHKNEDERREEKGRQRGLIQAKERYIEKRAQAIEHNLAKRLIKEAIKRKEVVVVPAVDDKEAVAPHEKELRLQVRGVQ